MHERLVRSVACPVNEAHDHGGNRLMELVHGDHAEEEEVPPQEKENAEEVPLAAEWKEESEK